jgi:hypothetical protein
LGAERLRGIFIDALQKLIDPDDFLAFFKQACITQLAYAVVKDDIDQLMQGAREKIQAAWNGLGTLRRSSAEVFD